MTRIVISQPMYFPWVGFIEQIRLADVFVIYDDVQFSKGSFTNRVQIKTKQGSQWLTVPIKLKHLGMKINEMIANEDTAWRSKHRNQLIEAYKDAPFVDDMLKVVDEVFKLKSDKLSLLAHHSTLALIEYLRIKSDIRFVRSSDLGIHGTGSQRVFDIVQSLGGTTYITGHGARNYLNHEMFDAVGISVEYMKYRCVPFPQLNGPFTPFVTTLDLIANCGRNCSDFICSETVNWKVFLDESE